MFAHHLCSGICKTHFQLVEIFLKFVDQIVCFKILADLKHYLFCSGPFYDCFVDMMVLLQNLRKRPKYRFHIGSCFLCCFPSTQLIFYFWHLTSIDSYFCKLQRNIFFHGNCDISSILVMISFEGEILLSVCANAWDGVLPQNSMLAVVFGEEIRARLQVGLGREKGGDDYLGSVRYDFVMKSSQGRELSAD